MGIFSIPSDNKIKGWVQGNDGDEYLLEYSTKSVYSFKAYWTPSVQGVVPAARALNKLNRDLRKLLNLETHWEEFVSGLPRGKYHAGEMGILRHE